MLHFVPERLEANPKAQRTAPEGAVRPSSRTSAFSAWHWDQVLR